MARQPCIAVIGTGSIGSRHLRVLKRMGAVRLIAVPLRASRMPDLRAEGYEAAASLEEAAGAGATHCIVATDTGRHLGDSLAAAALGLDLLVEKPLARDAAEAERLWLSATGSGRKVFVACLMRFAASLSRFRERLKEIGRLHAVRIECQSYLPDWRPGRPFRDSYSARLDEGGVLRDLVHEIDYAGWLYGWPDRLQARVRNHGILDIQAEESADLFWEGRDGVEVSLRLDYLSRPPRRRMTAFGLDGALEWDGVRNVVTFWSGTGAAAPEEAAYPQIKDDLLEAQVRAFLSETSGGPATILATGLEGVRALAVCDAARRASEAGCEEKVSYS